MGFVDDDPHLGDVLLTESQIAERIEQLGVEITADYEGRQPLLVVVLRGAAVFATDLARRIDLPLDIDYIAVSSYGSSTRTSGVVRMVKDLDTDVTDRHVILLEDIVDSGLTLKYLRRNLEGRQPSSLEVCALLARSSSNGHRGPDNADVRYVGFNIEADDYVVGYGLDAAQIYRNLPYVARYRREID